MCWIINVFEAVLRLQYGILLPVQTSVIKTYQLVWNLLFSLTYFPLLHTICTHTLAYQLLRFWNKTGAFFFRDFRALHFKIFISLRVILSSLCWMGIVIVNFCMGHFWFISIEPEPFRSFATTALDVTGGRSFLTEIDVIFIQLLEKPFMFKLYTCQFTSACPSQHKSTIIWYYCCKNIQFFCNNVFYFKFKFCFFTTRNANLFRNPMFHNICFYIIYYENNVYLFFKISISRHLISSKHVHVMSLWRCIYVIRGHNCNLWELFEASRLAQNIKNSRANKPPGLSIKHYFFEELSAFMNGNVDSRSSILHTIDARNGLYPLIMQFAMCKCETFYSVE